MTVKKEPNFYLIVELSYNFKIVVPLQEGLDAVDLFQRAEEYDTSDYKNITIGPAKERDFAVKLLSADKYKELKMAHTLLQKSEDDKSS